MLFAPTARRGSVYHRSWCKDLTLATAWAAGGEIRLGPGVALCQPVGGLRHRAEHPARRHVQIIQVEEPGCAAPLRGRLRRAQDPTGPPRWRRTRRCLRVHALRDLLNG